MSVLHSLFEAFKAHARCLAHARQVRRVCLKDGLKGAGIVLVFVARNERARLSYFLDHYRRLGVEHFIYLDNESDDGSLQYAGGQGDVSAFSCVGAYGRSRFGNDWINYVLNRHCVGKWIIYADPDEMLVYPECPTRRLSSLAQLMAKNGQRSLRTLMLDMYSDSSPARNLVASGEDPGAVCSLFDATGYREFYEASTKTHWIKGGPRGRLFFAEDLSKGPALNKTPFVRWRFGYAFLKSSHQLWPFRLNSGSARGRPVSGALLHFKFTSQYFHKVAEERVRGQHDREYASYTIAQDDADEPSFRGEASRTYRDWTTLVGLGLMQDGEFGSTTAKGLRPGSGTHPSAG